MSNANQSWKHLVATATAVISLLSLSGCKPDPDLFHSVPCSETIQVTQRNGVEVVQTVSGLFIKAKARGFGYICVNTPETRHLIRSSRFDMRWANGQFMPEIGPGYTAEQWGKLTRDEQEKSFGPWTLYGAYVNGDISFGNEKNAE